MDELPESTPPLVVDIDGTITDDDRVLDPRVLPVLRAWPSPVVIATGKALPFPTALCDFAGIPIRVVAENGGVAAVADTDELFYLGDRQAAQAVVDEYVEAGYDTGWPKTAFVNDWRETEVAVAREQPLEPLEAIAADHGLEVVDTGYAYHVKDTRLNKGRALERITAGMDVDLSDFLAVGDSPNDVSTFEVVGEAVAVANAEESARAAADRVTDRAFADGFFEAVGADTPIGSPEK